VLQDLASTLCGMYVGCSWQDYSRVAEQALGVTAYTATGIAGSVVSGRISYSFGLKGPAVTIDTACSSSLVALHMAVNGLRLRQCSTAAGCGVNLILHPETFSIAQKAGMLTYDGRCKTLSADADGYGRAESCGAVLLGAAGQVADQPVAVVRGTALNQDGRSSSLTAPNGPSQQEVVRAAMHAARLAAADVDILQMHGTGGRSAIAAASGLRRPSRW
jgi:acyl transferase domain-containing protein